MDDIRYTIKCTSKEGIFYLVNGWNKAKTFWFSEETVSEDIEKAKEFFFKKPHHAKSSLTRLLKIMEDYKDDKFELVEFK